MTKYEPIYAQAAAYNARKDRTVVTHLWSEGVMDAAAFVVTQRAAAANFTVDITAGVAVVTGDSDPDQGRYLCVETEDTPGTTVTSAPSAGNERYDRVILEVRDDAEDSGGVTDWRFRVVAGTPQTVASGTAVPPAVPSTAISLAVIGPIVNGTTAITDALITDDRDLARFGGDYIPEQSVTLEKIAPAAYATGATANTLVMRNADGRIAIGDPTAGNNAATKSYVDGRTPTAWTEVTYASGWISNGFGGLRYCRAGGVLFLAGQVQRSSGSTIATLPAGFRPATEFAGKAVTDIDGISRSLRVRTTGAIDITAPQNAIYNINVVIPLT